MSTIQRFLSLTLADGRRLAWREYGRPTGIPVFFLHGNLNSRLFQAMWSATEEKTEAAGARVIAIDRPGYGESTFNSAASYSSTARDIECLANYLNIEQFAVMGYSSGGPHALACVSVLPVGKVIACGLVSPAGPFYDMGEATIEKMYGGLKEVTAENNGPRTEREYESLLQSYSIISKEDRKEMVLADLANAVAQGLDPLSSGPAQDGLLETRPWGFDYTGPEAAAQLGAVPILHWHGTEDEAVTVDVARYLANHVPYIQTNIIEGESHSMIRRHWDKFLATLLSTITSEKKGKISYKV